MVQNHVLPALLEGYGQTTCLKIFLSPLGLLRLGGRVGVAGGRDDEEAFCMLLGGPAVLSRASALIRPKVADGDRKKRSPALQEPIFGVFGAPNFTNTPKKQKVIGKKIISGLLTVLRRPVYASGHYKCP